MKYDCSCLPGYELNDDSTVCVDINECNVDGSCPLNAACTNSDGSFQCACLNGFELINGNCDDIDECQPDIRTCHSTATCVNTPGSHTCTCDHFGDPETDIGCYDEEICLYLGSMCDNDPISVCVDSPSGPECACPSSTFANYETIFNDDGTVTCEDIDECLNPNQCPEQNTRCVNTPGHFGCPCVPGTDYAFDYLTFSFSCQDIDECVLLAACSDVANSDCQNTHGSYNCNCHQGWTKVGDVCEDVDECLGENSCPIYSICTNLIGSYDCNCEVGYEAVGDNEGLLECFPCAEGFDAIDSDDGNYTQCVDINECDTGACDDAVCINTIGSYDCTCDEGMTYHFDSDGHRCEDIDECADGTNLCGDMAICSNNIGSYTCSCVEGEFNSMVDADGVFHCTDVDECADEIDHCDDNSFCGNTIGSFTCTCFEGFNQVDEFTCEDVNECAEGLHDCGLNAVCENIEGSFICSCEVGYEAYFSYERAATNVGSISFDATFDCFNIDECAGDSNNCGSTAICTDNEGSFECSCPIEGYELTLNHLELDTWDCADVDECANGEYDCGANTNCVNTDGRYACECKSGYEISPFDSNDCENINECNTVDHNCGDNMICEDLDGSFDCHCLEGFQEMLDDPTENRFCVDIDECLVSDEMCPVNKYCVNMEPGFDCVCDSGLREELVDGLLECVDIDECDLNPLEACPFEYAACINEFASWSCDCIDGFEMINSFNDSSIEDGSGNGFDVGNGTIDTVCVDVDECLDTFACPDPHATCTNNVGSFECTCADGYDEVYIGDQFTGCVDMNECEVIPGICPAHSTCINHQPPQSWECLCNDGYYGGGIWRLGIDGDSDGDMCFDIDECAAGIFECQENSSCVNTPGSYTCECDIGFDYFKIDGNTTCLDIDECVLFAHECDPNAVCMNTAGTYVCECGPGFMDLYGDGRICEDINECEENACDQLCTNMHGSFECSCYPGYEAVYNNEIDRIECIDINECLEYEGSGDEYEGSSDACLPNSICSNTDGSYVCECDPGYVGDGMITGCHDVDECIEGTHSCSDHAYCKNDMGTHYCECIPGFHGDGIVCEDNDECLFETHSCHHHATCTNTMGSYACACNIGFDGHGFACENINECAFETHSCSDENSICVDTEGSYLCECDHGFIDMYGDGSVCEDINECEENACDQLCTNMYGSFECSCYEGYETIFNTDTNRVECLDIDECTTGASECNPDATCTNSDGSYFCECNAGFEDIGAKNDLGHLMGGVNCVDIDECLDADACPENSNCVNMIGSHDCTCTDGFEWMFEDNGTPMLEDDFMFCVDIDECAMENDCHSTAVCVNKPGGYTCECEHFGDPNTGRFISYFITF